VPYIERIYTIGRVMLPMWKWSA